MNRLRKLKIEPPQFSIGKMADFIKKSAFLWVFAAGIFMPISATYSQSNEISLPIEIPGEKPATTPTGSAINLQELSTGGAEDVTLGTQLGGVDIEAAAAEVQDPSLDEPLAVSLSALLTQDGPIIQQGLTWRIYQGQLDESRQLSTISKTNDSTPVINLVPGEYVVHVSYGYAQSSQTIQIVPGEVHKQIVLDIGGLSLNASVTNDIPIPFNQLSFDIFTESPQTGDRVAVARDIRANTLMHLNAGTYHVVSSYGTTNATVRADIRVESAQLINATLIHNAAEVTFKLVSSLGGDAIADVAWVIKDQEGETVFEDRSAFPRAVLEEGEYILVARSGEEIYNRDIQVTSGEPREMEILARN